MLRGYFLQPDDTVVVLRPGKSASETNMLLLVTTYGTFVAGV